MIAAKLMTTSKTFASTCHSVSIEDIKKLVPHLIERTEYSDAYYDEHNGKVYKNVHYTISGRTVKSIDEVESKEAIKAIL